MTDTINTTSGFPLVSPTEIQDELYRDMALSFYDKTEEDAELNSLIKVAWKNRFGSPLNKILINSTVASMYLHGGPGHGKTTSFKKVAEQLGNDIGLNVLINPKKERKIGKDDLLFISHELSGVNSVVEFGGMPAKKDNHMEKLPNYHFAMLGSARASVLLLDDFANASPAIQNVALSITNEKRFQELNLGNCYIGVTGNLGAADNTHTAKLSAALRSRCKNYEVQDELGDYCARAIKNHNDPIADAGLIGFLRKNPDLFAPKVPAKGSFPCPRTWDLLLNEVRIFVSMEKHKYMNKESAMMINQHLTRVAEGLVGKEAGRTFGSYFYAMYTGAEPIASEFMQKGQLSKENAEKLNNITENKIY